MACHSFQTEKKKNPRLVKVMLLFLSGAVPQETLKQRVCHPLPDSKWSRLRKPPRNKTNKRQFWLPLRRTAEGIQGSSVGTVTGSFAREGTLHGAGTLAMHRRQHAKVLVCAHFEEGRHRTCASSTTNPPFTRREKTTHRRSTTPTQLENTACLKGLAGAS